MSKRSEQIRAEKEKCNALGHEMGNAVNVTPIRGSQWTVTSTCRLCGLLIFISGYEDHVRSSFDDLERRRCQHEGTVEIKATGSHYDPAFVERMDRILAFVAAAKSEHVIAFPLNVEQAYANTQCSRLYSSFAAEMFEGNEPEGDTPSEEELADKCIGLMCRVREDLDFIISRLYEYTPEGGEAALATVKEWSK